VFFSIGFAPGYSNVRTTSQLTGSQVVLDGSCIKTILTPFYFLCFFRLDIFVSPVWFVDGYTQRSLFVCEALSRKVGDVFNLFIFLQDVPYTAGDNLLVHGNWEKKR